MFQRKHCIEYTKKLTAKLQERFAKFWRRSIWSSNSVNNNHNGNKLRIYRHFKKSFVIESYLTSVKNPSHRKAICQLRTSSHSLMCEVGRFINIPYDQRTCLFCSSKKLNQSDILCLNISFILIQGLAVLSKRLC